MKYTKAQFIHLINSISPKLKLDFIANLFANTAAYMVTFCGAIIYVHLLGKHDYGLYTFAYNIISMFLLVNAFGAASGVLQFVSKTDDLQEQHEYLRFAFQMGCLFNFLLSIGIILYANFATLPINNTKTILLAMAFLPLARIYLDVCPAYLRAKNEHIKQAKFVLINSIGLIIFNLIGILTFHIYGLIYSTYLLYICMLIYAIYKFKLPALISFKPFQYVQAKIFIHYSFFSSMSNAFSGLLFILDILIISYVIKDANLIATYKVATIIPFAINFIPGVIMSFYYPRFVQNKGNNKAIKNLTAHIRKRMFIFSFSISIILVIIAKPLILTIFGQHYINSIIPFQIISGGYFIAATFRIMNGNILAALGHARISFYITLINLLINIGVTYWLVKMYSIIGAAIAIIIMYAISSIVSQIVLYQTQK